MHLFTVNRNDKNFHFLEVGITNNKLCTYHLYMRDLIVETNDILVFWLAEWLPQLVRLRGSKCGAKTHILIKIKKKAHVKIIPMVGVMIVATNALQPG